MSCVSLRIGRQEGKQAVTTQCDEHWDKGTHRSCGSLGEGHLPRCHQVGLMVVFLRMEDFEIRQALVSVLSPPKAL